MKNGKKKRSQLEASLQEKELFAVAKKQLNQQGLHPLSQLDWLRLTKEFSDLPWIQSTKQKVSHYARF